MKMRGVTQNIPHQKLKKQNAAEGAGLTLHTCQRRYAELPNQKSISSFSFSARAASIFLIKPSVSFWISS